jgi:outer membrane lipoprotein-sorting protein
MSGDTMSGNSQEFSSMKPFRILVVALSALALAFPAPVMVAQANGAQLTTVLTQMDAASARFKNARADFRQELYERVVRDTTVETGSIYFERAGNSMEMGAVTREAGSPQPRVIAYKSGELRMFDPGVNQVTVLHAGANQAQYESFLTLGFGGSGRDLAEVWNITDQGPETMQEGGHAVKTEKLDLVAKEISVRNTFSHITIWVDPSRDVSLKQIFYAPNGDTRTAVYSNIKVNGSIDKGAFKMDTNKSTTTVNR